VDLIVIATAVGGLTLAFAVHAAKAAGPHSLLRGRAGHPAALARSMAAE
jgi:hypothetical protein